MMQPKHVLMFALLPFGLCMALPITADDFVIRETESFDVDRQLSLGLLRDDQVVLQGTPESVPAVGLPESSDLDAYTRTDDGTTYFSTDTTVDLGAGLIAGPGDVVRVDPDGSLSLEIDRAALGIASGSAIDALTTTDDPAFPLALSFDTTVELPAVGGTVLVDDEDLAKTDGTVFEIYFDGSLVGVNPASDLDAAQLDLDSTELRVSFDTSGQLSGFFYDDEDVLGYDLSTGDWRLIRDTSSVIADLVPGADVDAYTFSREFSLFADGFESGNTVGWSSAMP